MISKPPAPSLGRLVGAWVGAHCVVPGGRFQGAPFTMYRWQAICTVGHYRIKPAAELGQLAGAFANRRSLVVGPQKIGKGPWSATIVATEAVGPALFAGWAQPGDGYACSEHGCGCGWEYEYRPGDPMGRRWPKPLIQLTATSEDQVANVYQHAFQPIVRMGPLADLLTVGEEFTRIVDNDGRIDVVTSSAQSRLGQPITFALQDETGIWTKTNKMIGIADTQRRGAAGMGGRTMETTNAPDPSVESQALATLRRSKQVGDIFVYFREPPASLGDYLDPVCRRKIHEFAYADCAHVDQDEVEAEAAEILIDDPRQAERFYGNRMVAGSAKWSTSEKWGAGDPTVKVGKRERITIGMDGSDGTAKANRVADSTVIRGCRLEDGFRFTIGVWEHEPGPDGEYGEWYVPRTEVMEKIRWAFAYYDVVLAGFDPPYWRSEIAELAEEFGEDRIVEFRTANDQLMAAALQSLSKTDTPHDGCEITRRHVLNAVTHVKEYRDDNDERKKLVLVSKPTKDSPDKIDALISDAIAHDMRNRAIAAGVRKKRAPMLVTFG